MKTTLKLRSFLFACGSLLAVSSASADTIYWDGGNNLSWNTASNWTTVPGAATPDPVSVPGALDDAIFNRTGQNGNIAVRLDADQAALSLTFNSAGTTTIVGNTSGTTARQLTLGTGGITVNSGAGAVGIGTTNNGIINVVLSGNQTWTNNSNNALNIGTAFNNSATSANIDLDAFNLIIDGSGRTNFGVVNQANAVLTGTGTLTKNGTGFLQLGGNNSAGFSGKVTINGGVVNYGDVPTALGTGNLEINGGILEARWTTGFTKTQGTGAGEIQITGGVSGFGQSNNATFNVGNVTWGSATFAPTEFVLHGATASATAGIIFSSAIDLNGANRTIRSDQSAASTGSGTFSGNITNGTGTAGLIKVGVGRHVLTGTNTYNGGTTISEGTLQFGNITAMPSSGAVAVSSGAAIGIDLGGAGDWTTGTSGVGTLGGLLAGLGGAGTSTVTYAGDVGLRLNAAANSTYSGDIANPTGSTSLQLIKDGTSSLTLSGNNSYSGGTTLVNGALIVASNTAIPNTGTIALNGGTIQSNDATARSFTNAVTIGGNFTVGGTGNITFSNTGASALGATRQITVNTGINATFAQAFSGTGAGITKAGAGTLTLTGANTYTGVTTVSAGKLVLNNGTVSSSAVSFNGSNTAMDVLGGIGVNSTWNAGGGEFKVGDNNYNNIQVLIDGKGTAGSARVIGVSNLIWGRTASNSTITLTDGGQMNVNGEIRIGNPYYSLLGGANMTIGGGTATSTFTGNTAQDFYIGYGERRGASNNVVTVNSGGVLTNIRDMFVGHVNNGQNAGAPPASGNQLTVTGTGTASMRGISVGYAQVGFEANANVVQVTNGGTLTTSGFATNYIGRALVAGSTSNANTLTVTGTGSSWNAGAQTVYVGHTANATATSNNNILTVGAGASLTNVSSLIVGFGTGTETGNQLVVNGSLSATSVTVNAGNSLSGSGTINAPVTVNGTYSPGQSPGTMTFQNTLTLAASSSTTIEVDGTNGAGAIGGHDFTNLTGVDAAGVLTYGGTMTIDIGVIFGAGAYSWNLFDFASETGGFTGIILADQYSGSLTDGGGGVWGLVDGDDTWQFTESTGVLGLTVIPEPSAALLGGLGALLLLRRRR